MSHFAKATRGKRDIFWEITMSGHSKWSQIKRQKGAADVKRGVAFGKLTNAIILAARSGGDPSSNFSLKMAIEKGKAANMPKENVERAIKRGTGELGGAKVEEVLYEALGPVGIGIIIEAATDNRNRTNSEIKNVLTKHGAKIVSSGAITYQFERKGKLLTDIEGKDRDELELSIIDAGAEDFDEQEDVLAVYTAPQELEMVKRSLEEKGISIHDASLVWEGKNIISISEVNDSQKVLNLMETIDNLDDVTAVYSNFDLTTRITNLNK